MAIGRRSNRETPARCRTLTAGSREKRVESAVNNARRPAIPTIGEERDGVRAPSRHLVKIHRGASSPKAM
jgi:hypothetical protein